MGENPCEAFAAFGLPCAFALDKALLRRRYLALQRRLHPDVCPGSERQVERLNAAYGVLMDDVRRANALFGGRCAAPAHLDEQLAFGERKQALLERGDAAGLAALARELDGRLADLTARFAAAAAAGQDERARALLGDMNFYRRQADQLRAPRGSADGL